MKSASTALKTHLASATTSIATFAKVTLENGDVRAFTDHDRDLTIDAVVYVSSPGFFATDTDSSSDLEMDNLEMQGAMNAPAITEDELRAGVWDFAYIVLFVANWADLTQGIMIERAGRIGQVSAEGNAFRAEMAGLMRAFKETIGELTSPTCRANLGDSRCRVDLYPLTVTGTVTSVNDDGITFYDTSRTEDGPEEFIDVLQITATDPAVVSLVENIPGFHDLMPIVITDVASLPELNTVWRLTRVSGASAFSVPVDATSLGSTLFGEGRVRALAGATGHFDHGIVTWLTGANANRSMEVRQFSTGQITLILPMPDPIEVGDTYQIVPGCDNQLATCIDRFDNVLNFRGEPYLPGMDKYIQVGRKT